jgi:hypothetical protein
MSDSSKSYPFPHPTLTKIDGKPNAASIKLLTKEVYANAKSVHSVHGGELNGHLGLAMLVAAYVLRAGINFVEPPHPAHFPSMSSTPPAPRSQLPTTHMICL